jgi:hypothetical protein
MAHGRIFSIRLEKLHQLFSFRRAETRTDSDVLQSAGVVEQPEQQRADHCVLALFMPAESSHHAIAVAFVFHFKHHSLVRLVSSCRIFGHHTIQAGAFKAAKPIGGNTAIAGCRC